MFVYKSILYCETRKTEICTIKVNISVLVCTLSVSVNDKLLLILPYQRKPKAFRRFLYFSEKIFKKNTLHNLRPNSELVKELNRKSSSKAP